MVGSLNTQKQTLPEKMLVGVQLLEETVNM